MEVGDTRIVREWGLHNEVGSVAEIWKINIVYRAVVRGDSL